MRSMFLHATMATTLTMAAATFAPQVTAGALKYTFGTVSGGAYCDGLTLSTTDKRTYTGKHTGCGGNLPADGSRVKGHGGSYLDVQTTGPGDPTPLTFFLFLKQNEWQEYITLNGSPVEINSGVLIKGAPGNNGKSSRETDPKALLDRVF